MRSEAAVPDEDPGGAGIAVFGVREVPELLADQLRAAADRQAPRGDGAAGGGGEGGDGVRLIHRPSLITHCHNATKLKTFLKIMGVTDHFFLCHCTIIHRMIFS